MKLLFSIAYYSPYLSGLTIHTKRLAEAFVKKKYDVTVITTQHEKSLPLTEIQNGVKIQRVPFLFRISKGFFMPLYFFVAYNAIKQTDVIIINLPQFEGFILAILAKLLHKKIICIYHCEIQLPQNYKYQIITYVLTFSHVITLSLANKIVTYTKDFASHSKLLKLYSQKVNYILPPIPKPNKSKSGELKSIKKMKEKNMVCIGIAARFAQEKGFEYVFKAIPYIEKQVQKKIMIFIAGPKHPIGEEAYIKKLEPLLHKYRKSIIFLGSLSGENLGDFYSSIDVLVLPSINSTEAFGMVQVEAMLCGTPVVASNLPGVRIPITLTGMGEIAKIKDSKNLAIQIIKVIRDSKKYKKPDLLISNIFSFNKTITTYEKLIREKT